MVRVDITVSDQRRVPTATARSDTEAYATAIGFSTAQSTSLGRLAASLADRTETILLERLTRDDGTAGLRIIATGSRGTGPISIVTQLSQFLGVVDTLTGTIEAGAPTYGAVSWVSTDTHSREIPYRTDAAVRPINQHAPNGDAVIAAYTSTVATVGVIDGLGHGVAANRAARIARNQLLADFDRGIEVLFSQTEQALTDTRGVVMAIVQFDWDDRMVSFGSVGNINARAIGTEHPSLVARRGVVGNHSPEPIVVSGTFDSFDRLVMHTDGIDTNWTFAEIADQSGRTATRYLLDRYGHSDDDAGVLIVSPTPNNG